VSLQLEVPGAHALLLRLQLTVRFAAASRLASVDTQRQLQSCAGAINRRGVWHALFHGHPAHRQCAHRGGLAYRGGRDRSAAAPSADGAAGGRARGVLLQRAAPAAGHDAAALAHAADLQLEGEQAEQTLLRPFLGLLYHCKLGTVASLGANAVSTLQGMLIRCGVCRVLHPAVNMLTCIEAMGFSPSGC